MSNEFTNAIDKQIEYLASRNSGISELRYFYDFARNLYRKYPTELRNSKSVIIGTFCNFVPEELVLAAGAFPIRLCGGFRSTVPKAEQFMPANFCPMLKSSYGLLLENSPLFNSADLLVVPTTCDGKKKLCELLAEHKETWVLEVPHTTESPAGRELWLNSVQMFMKELERRTKTKITAKKLRQSIELCNRKRAALRRLYELRKRAAVPIWGRDALLVTMLAFFDAPTRFTLHTERLCTELERCTHPVADGQRLLLTGSPVMLPALKVPVVIEESGGIIVADDICTGSKSIFEPVMPAHWTINDELVAIADKYLMNKCACFTPNTARVTQLLQLAKDYRIDGVVYYILQACHTYAIESWKVEKMFKTLNIPMFRIETDFGEQDVGQLRLRMEAFMEMLVGK